MTLRDNSKRIGRQPAYFSNMRRKQNGMYDYISGLDGVYLWQKYVTYTQEFDQLHKEVQDMQKALTYNRKGKDFNKYMGKHEFYTVNLARICASSYSWKVFTKFKWTIEKYKEYIA